MNSKFFKLFLVMFLTQIFITNNLKAQELLFDNGPFITNTGVGFGGSDVSVMENVTLGYTTLGYSVNNAGNTRITDQFTNSAPWYLDYVDVFAYQTGSSVSSTFTSGVVKIWNSDPSSGTAISEFGDFTTNRMILTDFTNCYRVQENVSLLTNNRPIMRIRISIGAIIQPGTHWIEWGLTGTLASGPFAPSISILGTGNTGDAKQFNTTAYTGTLPNGAYQVGIPFKIFGSQFVSYSPSPNAICPGSNVTVNFLDPVVRNTGNSYKLELSDINGNFPGTVLTTTVVSASQLSAVIPISTVGSANYKIRTVASSPSENSSPSDFLNVYTPPNAVVASQTDVSCNGGSNGTASVTALGGTGGYTYSWSPSGGTAATASGLSAGTYTVTVTDANGCKATQNFTITEPTALTATAASQTNVSCNGGSNGAASINTPTGGAGGYTYNWTPGNPTGDGTTSVTGLTPGTWTCTVTDANNCTTAVNFTITQPTALTATAASQTNVSCNGGSNGAASINTPTGGAGGYTYNWTPGNPTGDGTTSVTGLTPGTWTCTVTDANNCTTAVNFTITQPTALTATAASQTNVSCNGGSNGAASINTPTGGAGGYTYNWTPGNPTGDGTTSVTGLTPGTWTCTVTDANNCTTAVNFTITQPTALTATAASQTNVSCNGGSNGAASINTPTGGAGGYTYNWTPGNPTGDGTTSVTGLTPGTWTCTVTDANNCTAAVNFTITQPTALTATAASQTNVSCNGGSNGAASINTPTGGAGGYTYNWTPGNPTGDGTTSVTGLTPGTWTCTVTDANNCTAAVNFAITQPTALTATAASQTNVSCNGGSNGAASINTPTGGAGGYTYNWTPGNPTGDGTTSVTGLTPGTWTCTVTDANNCTAAVNFTITQPTALTATAASQTNVSCNGGSNGAASINTPTGGAGGYTYNWTPGNPTGDGTTSVTGLTPGTWTCTVTDANNCTTAVNFTITQPTALTATAASQTNVSCNGGSNGAASINTPTGGAGGYTYNWTPGNPTGDGTTSVTGLTPGTWTCTVTDANNCTAAVNFTITQPTAISFTTTVLSGYDYNTGYSQTIIASGGTGSKTYAVTAGSLPSGFTLSTTGQITGTSTQIADSNFTVTATDANNCNATYNYVLKLNQIPITVTATPSQTKIYGESDPVLTYTVSPSLLSGDSFTGSLTRVSGENIGSYAINQGSLSAGSKYLITYVGANFAITAKPITVTAAPSQTKVYGTTDPVFAYTVSPNLVGSDAFTGALTRVAGENIGTYAITQGNLSAGSNYTISYADANFTITAKPITVTAAVSQTKVYGTTDPAFSYTVSSGLVGSDAFTGTLTRVTGENIGNYAINQGSLSAGSNYAITYVSKDFTITAKPITVTADASQTKVYGTANPVYTYTVSPSLVSGDSFTGTLTRATGENIGNYAITQGSLSAGSNYAITYVSKDFTITAKPITVTANASQTKVYGTTDPVFAYTVSPNLVSSDSFTGTLTRAVGENVGVYTITQGTLSAGGNYTITYNGSDFTITKANQVITWNQTLGLGCDGETSIVLTAVANSGLAVNYASSNANIATVSNNSLIFQNYGSATITASQPGSMNYNAAPSVVLPVVSSQPNLIRKHFEDVIFFDNSSKSFKSYNWYKNGVLVPGQTSQYFKESGPLNGTYYAVATKLDGTLITTCTLTLSPTMEEEYIRIVPNPVRSNTTFQLITNVSPSRLQNARVELYNLTGNLLTTINTSQNTIDMTAPNVEGIYIVKMTLANGKYFTKNLLVRN